MKDVIQSVLGTTITEVPFNGAPKIEGKVRESFDLGDQRAIVVTDRISAFDFILGTVPFKGQVLNQIAAWWFRQLPDSVHHHLIDTPHANITLARTAEVLPIEVVVRAYLTGTTKTSSWYAYNNYDRVICGIEMPAGMKKNEAFSEPMITPTTKPKAGSGLHDVPISKEEILAQGLVIPEVYAQVEAFAMTMFTFGQKKAAERGLILVDTKYEMGIDSDGNLMVVDEVHTPDSSRYWIADTYQERLAAGEEPDMLDKEFVRRMVVAAGYDVNDETQNPADFLTDDLRVVAAQKYIELYERITGEKFVFEPYSVDSIVETLEKMCE